MKKIILLFFLLINCLFAQNIENFELIKAEKLISIYKSKGVTALEDELEKMLQDRKYWQNYLLDKDIRKGYYEFDTPIVFVDKITKKMDLYHYEDFKPTLTSSQNVITGKMGDKQQEGDLKTPVGVYDIIKRFAPSDDFYGPLAFVLSYPNLLDKLYKKNGYGIWIHGFPMSKKEREVSTKGCVAMDNNILLQFDKDLKSEKSIVIISESGDVIISKQDMELLLASLFQWRHAWKYSKADKYLSFYSDDFIRFDGTRFKKFAAMKKQIFSRHQQKTIIFKNIAISPYPSLKFPKLFRIKFDEIYKTKDYNFTGQKELYVKIEDDKMQIIAEK